MKASLVMPMVALPLRASYRPQKFRNPDKDPEATGRIRNINSAKSLTERPNTYYPFKSRHWLLVSMQSR